MADQRIQCSEEMVGAGHPTKQDTLNRMMLVEHEIDGTHKSTEVHGLTPSDSPTFVTTKLTGLTDGKIPYHVNDTTGLADGPTKTDVHACKGDEGFRPQYIYKPKIWMHGIGWKLKE